MKNMVKLLSLAAGVVLCAATFALAEEFSADMVSTSKGGTFKGKIFVSNDKSRMETPESITISRMDKSVLWILMPNDKMYMEQPIDPGQAAATSEKVDGEIERTLIGQEKIDGTMTKKYQVVSSHKGQKTTLLQWIAPGLTIPVKTAATDNSWSMEYKDIKTGRQDDSLFEIPVDYKKLSYQMPDIKGALQSLLE